VVQAAPDNQQLAKRLFTKGERTFTRKILEVILALQIERKFSKDEILEMYFNQIYLDTDVRHISAADLFFNKDVKHLNLAKVRCSRLFPPRGRHSPSLTP